MLDILPTEVILNVLSGLPIPLLLSLTALSRSWFNFFTLNQSSIFHSASFLHEFIQPRTWLLDVALSMKTGRPWTGSTSWKDFCLRSFQLQKNWEGTGRAAARVLSPPHRTDHCTIVDEKAGICITTHLFGGLTVTHLFSGTVLWCLPQSQVRTSSDCAYDNGYLVFDHKDGVTMDVWRLATDISADGEVSAPYLPPDNKQMIVSARAAEVYHHYAPRGHFRPWTLLRIPGEEDGWNVYRLVYPTLINADVDHAFLYDIRTGFLVQTINLRLFEIEDVDVNERHAFVCDSYVVHVFSRMSGHEILRIRVATAVECGHIVEDPAHISGDWFTTPISLFPIGDDVVRPYSYMAGRVSVSRDGRDLVVLSPGSRVVFIQDFERICRGETTLEKAGLVLDIPHDRRMPNLGFEDGRVCVATIQGLYIFTIGPERSVKAMFVRPSKNPISDRISYVKLTDRRIYFTWADATRRQDIPLFEDAENAREALPPPPTTPTLDVKYKLPRQYRAGDYESNSLGCIDFSVMRPEGYA